MEQKCSWKKKVIFCIVISGKGTILQEKQIFGNPGLCDEALPKSRAVRQKMGNERRWTTELRWGKILMCKKMPRSRSCSV
jgi:hypothetical protein